MEVIPITEQNQQPLILRQNPVAHNFVLIGEAGGGKSEIAINLALSLADWGDKPVHIFDLDMTKPLFRTRDRASFLEEKGICIHFEEQFYDSPTLIGGIKHLLQDEKCYTILDVGGDYIGARSIGGFASLLNASDTVVWYVINPFRPWSMNPEHIDMVLSQVLGVSHIRLDHLHFIGNPNVGPGTTVDDVNEGIYKLIEMVSPDIDFFTVRKDLVGLVDRNLHVLLFPIRPFLTYEWTNE